ncbi:hypothetical protein LAZ67_1001171, partial [Cordylochernes scorpioides]
MDSESSLSQREGSVKRPRIGEPSCNFEFNQIKAIHQKATRKMTDVAKSNGMTTEQLQSMLSLMGWALKGTEDLILDVYKGINHAKEHQILKEKPFINATAKPNVTKPIPLTKKQQTKPAPKNFTTAYESHVLIKSDNPSKEAREILREVKKADPSILNSSDVAASLNGKGRLVIHTRTTQGASTLAARFKANKNIPNSLKCTERPIIHPRFCLFGVESCTTNNMILESLQNNEDLKNLSGTRMFKIAHRPKDNPHGYTTIFLEVDNEVSNFWGHRGKIPIAGLILRTPFPCILGMDANAHSPTWGSGAVRDTRGASLEASASLMGLHFLGGPTPYTWSNGARRSSIDVTLASSSLAIHATRVCLQEMAFTDHLPILTNFSNILPSEPTSSWVESSCLEAAFAAFLGNTLHHVASRLQTALTPGDIDEAVILLTTCLQEACDASMKKKSKSPRPSKPWWNKELSKLRNIVVALRRCSQNTFSPTRSFFKGLYRACHNKLKAAIRRAKRLSWISLCQEVSSAAWSSIHRYISKGRRGSLGPPLLKHKDGTPLTSEETCREVLQNYFPTDWTVPRPTVDWLPTFNQEPAFTAAEIFRAIRRCGWRKSPGPDRLGVRCILLGGPALHELLSQIFTKCLRLGHFPTPWKAGRLVLIPKQNSTSSNPLDKYRPITMINTLAKVFERCILARLQWLADQHGWFSPMQFGFVPGRAAEGALDSINNFINDGLKHWRKTVAISLDISHAFDTVQRHTIIQGLRDLYCPEELIQLSASSLRDRKVIYQTWDSTLTAHTVLGVAQGAPLSPFFFNIVARKALSLPKPQNCQIICFADDFTLLFRAFRRLPTKEINKFLKTFSLWGKGHGLTFNLKKTQACLFHWKSKRPSYQNIKFLDQPILINNHIKILGITFDTTRTFIRHSDNIFNKCKWMLPRLISTIREQYGLTYSSGLKIIKMVDDPAKLQLGATIGRDAGFEPVALNPNIEITKYGGTEDPRPWIESLEEIGFLYHWAGYIIARYAAMNMTGSAKTWLNLHNASFTSWENIKIRLIQDFSLDANKEKLRMKLNRMQHWNEPAIRFAEDILVLCNKVDPAMEEETKIEHVIGGLKKEYSFALYLNPPKTTDDLLVVCKKMDSFEKKHRERVEKSRNLYNGPRYSRPQQQSRYVPPTAARNYQTTSRPQAPVSNNYKNDSPPTPRQYRNNFPQPSTPRRPYNPNFVPKPNLQRNTYNKSQEVSKNRTEDGRPICFKCNKPGHVARYCRVKFIRILEEDPTATQEQVEEKCQMNEISEKSGPRLYADSAKDSIVPECSIKLIKALVETEDGEYIIEESSKMFQTNGLRLARSLIKVINRETHIWITNPYPRPLKIMKNQTLAFGSSRAKINVNREREVEENEEPRFQINENLSPKEQKELKQVLGRYGDLFSSRLGRTNLAKHRIDTEDAKPIKHKPYRVSAKERDIIKEQIDEMLTEGIIRPSSSPWSFPVILVKKRDGKYRFYVDYRKLNNVTVKDVYPIPRIDEVMDTLQGSTYFSAIDLRSGYWQVEVEERDKEKTAFTTAHGLYEFNVMPFGLCTAPATFERNMENMLGNLRWQICLCYLDDVIIYSPDFPKHLKRLEAVFRCFRESNLRLNDKKCRFDFEELEILGYITSKHGHFNPNAPTYVHTDASNIGIGATLVQDIGGEEKVISYLSRTLSKAEQNYSTTEKECLAVVWSMSKLRPYLYGRHFKIVTDHHALCWLKNLKDPTGRLARWALKIQEYDFDIIHKSGKKHLDADGLSRGPLPETDWDEDFERLFLNQITDEEDKFIESVKKNLNGSRRSIAQNFKEEDGCLFKKNPNPEGRAWLLVVPEKKKREIMKEYHNHMSNGHLGVARTMYRIKSKYFWPSMLKDVSEFVKTCHLCQSRKGSNQLPSGLLQSIPPANFPFERIGIDFVGPLPSTKNRKKWIIVLTDYYTRYAETKAVSEATVKEVSKFLVEDIFLRHGAPQYLISDRGSQFTSNLMEEVMKMCKIKHFFTTSYHPQTNGLTERLNRTLINMLSMYVNTDQKNWDEILPFITHAYNTTIQETTGYSPFFLMFGREPTSLLDDRNISVDIDKDDYDEYIKHHLDKIDRTRNTNTIVERCRMVETRSGKMQDPAQERIKAEESAKPQLGATIGGDASSDPVVLNPNIDIPKYDGTEDPRPWIESLEEIGFLYHWADYIIARYAAMNMTGSAKTWLNLHKASFRSWENIKIRLIQDFSLDTNKEELRMKLNRMQHWNEPAIRFAEDILVLCNKVDPAMEEETKIDHVIGGLKKEYSFALYLNPPKTTDELLVVCKKMDSFEKKYRERVEKSRNLYNGPRYSRPQQQSRYVPPTATRNYQTPSRPQAPVSNNYKNDFPPTLRQYRNNLTQPFTPRRPYNPNFVPKPNLQRNTYNKSQEVSKNRTEDGRPICFKCNKPGHVARYCRVKFIRILEEDPTATQEKIEEKCQMNEISDKSGPRLYADIGTFEALVDTGADLSVVDLRTALDTGHGISKLAKTCAGPDGKKLDIVGSILLNIKIDDKALSHKFVILKTHLRTLIFGRDFLKKMNAKIDCKKEIIKYDLTNNHDISNYELKKIKSVEDTVIPELSIRLIKASIEAEDGEKVIEENNRMIQTNGLRLARSLLTVTDRKTHIWITNPYPRPLKIMKDQTLAHGSLPAEVKFIEKLEQINNDEIQFQINKNLSPKEQEDLKQILIRYADLFSPRLGRTNLAKHRIDTEDAKPIKHKPYRVSPKERDIIKDQIDEMLKEGIIRPSSSPWSFPVILVKKRDGKFRFCVDYRKLNGVTVKDVYPIPRIDDVMDTLQGSKYFSAIDLRSGYWQVEIEEKDKEKTAFTTTHGLYEFNVMPFGLCNAPATFERNMDNVLGNLRWQICLCYLDDVIIYSSDFPTHLKRLEAVLKCFSESNLKLNDKKCRFAFEELEILGHITNQQGIKPAEYNIKAVRDFPHPKKVKEVQSFLGMCSYYRKFIKDFSLIADPLTGLIRKNAQFTWTEKQEEAFQNLKKALINPPILGHFDPNAATFIHTDASNIGLGATLVQIICGEEKVISYLSRTLSKAEQNYSTTEKECLAVVWAISKLRPYLYGRHFKIITDHHALCWLKNLKDPTGRLARWALKIQEYDFDIIHKSGKKHMDADGLSRGPLPETDWFEDYERLFLNQIINEEDEFIENVKKSLKGSKRAITQNFKEENGCLYKKNPNPEGRAWLLVVPKKRRKEIMSEFHNHMLNGHLGVARTTYRLKNKYHWPSMLKDVSEFVKTCHLCQSRKGSNQSPSGLLQPIPPANYPFDRIGIDFVGPLPSTKRRRKWIIVLTDYYTRYAETKAVSEATMKEVSTFLIEQIFLRHGAPRFLISDRGSQFTSNLMKEVMKMCKVKHCFTTSYHPQTNGLTERLNRTLISMISMYVNTDQKNWDEILPFVTHAYNTTIQETTGYSPFFLLFGREPMSLLDDDNIPIDSNMNDYDEYIENYLDKIARTRQVVINSTEKTQERMKRNYDKKHNERIYEPGHLVAVWTPVRKIGKCEKLLRKYFGPYRILKKLSNVNYLIEPKDNPGQDPLIVHVSRLKPYFERIDEVTHED